MTSKINVLSTAQVKRFLMDDADNFTRSLSRVNLVARGAYLSPHEYIRNVCVDIEHLTKTTASLFKAPCDLADTFLSTWKPNPKLHGITSKDAKTIAAIPWRIALTPQSYENGLPHTRANIIFLPLNNILAWPVESLAKTLLHEKVHVFQRMFPVNAIAASMRLGCTPVVLKSFDSMLRSNPDIGGTFYIDKKGIIMSAKFRSDRPGGLEDVTISSSMGEHPYETMAYAIGTAFEKRPRVSTRLMLT